MEQKMVNLKINNLDVCVPEGTTILEACKQNNIKIPTLCYLKDLNPVGACRICLVEINNSKLVASCVFPVSEGMVVSTNNERVLKSRKANLELMLSCHDKRCLSCDKNTKCELQQLCYEYGCDSTNYIGEKNTYKIDDSSDCIIRNNNKCILCKRCVSVCRNRQSVNVINVNGRGFNSYVGCSYDQPLAKSACVGCGQCTLVCPTAALTEKNEMDTVISALNNKDYINVVATAPSVRVGIAEEFGSEVGLFDEGKMITALKRIGFHYVFDLDFGADLTVMEEANELIERLKENKNLPLMTSCSPGWVNYVEAYHPELLDNLSTAKSPQQIFGATLKTYWAEKMGIDPNKIFLTTIMPCTAKKNEAKKPHNIKDVDAVLTVREFAKLIKRYGINYRNLENGQFDNPLGMSSGAGVIFGNTGGVMEAALRTVSDTLEKKELEKVDYEIVRGLSGIKECTVEICGQKINIAVASGLKNAEELIKRIQSGIKQYHFVEIMACPGGCVGGGGMPLHNYNEISPEEIATARAKALYRNDLEKDNRKAHKNPAIIELYETYFDHPGSEKAHRILHTHFKAQKFDEF